MGSAGERPKPGGAALSASPAKERGFWTVAASITVIVLGANTPLPIFTVYQARWGFSTGLLTVIYGIYTIGVLIAVFGMGPASDLVGRKRVLLPALGTMALGLTVGLVAPNVWVLLASRLLQGLAVGAGTTTAVAALGELHDEPHDHGRIALTATVAVVLGLAGGPLVAGSLAQYAPAPTITPYIVALVLTGLAATGVAASPETVRARQPFRFRLVRVGLPAGSASAFWLATLVELTAYAVAGTFAGLGSSFARDLLGIQSHFAAGLVVALLFGCSAAAQIVLRHVPLRSTIAIGLAVLLIGLLVFCATVLLRSGPGLFLSAAVLGVGHGAAYLGSQELVDRVAPADRRAQIFSAFQLGLYIGATAPAILIGFAAGRFGLAAASIAFAAAVGLLALIALAWSMLGRSVAPPSS
jgi:MFS family permease